MSEVKPSFRGVVPRAHRAAKSARKRKEWVEQLETRLLLTGAFDECGCGGVSSDPVPTKATTAAAPLAASEGVSAPPQGAYASTPDAYNTDKANWLWFDNINATDLSASINQGYRLVDLEVENASPITFNAVLVQNAGSYAQGWYWFYNQTANDVLTNATANNARVTNISRYSTASGDRYASILTPNTGADAKAWWYYYGLTSAEVTTHLTQNNARLVDIDGYDAGGGQRRYTVVMISNTGADAKAWWYYYGQTPAQIASLTQSNNARLMAMDPVDSGHFDVIMESGQNERWWWYYGNDAQSTLDIALQNGARIFDVEPYDVSGQRRFVALMIDNSNAVEERVGDVLRGASATAKTGLYLKQVGGPVLAGIQPDKQFEPASMIKGLLNLTAMRAVQAGTDSLANNVFMYYNPANPYINFNQPGNPDECPDQYSQTVNNRVTMSLQQILENMMERSDNRATRAIDQRYGRPAINATAALAGMTNTVFASTLGCGVPGNYLTLTDAGKLYEGVLNGTLLNAANAAQFFRNMTDDDDGDRELVPFSEGIFGPFQDAVVQEAAALLGRPQTDPLVIALRNAFIAQMHGAWKGGGYTLSAPNSQWDEVRTVGGYVGLPFKQNTVTNERDYVYGVFIDGALVPQNPYPNPQVDAVNNAWSDSQRELLRDEIHKALATWSVNPGVSINNVTVAEGDSGTVNATFTVTLAKASDLPISLAWQTQAGTATAGTDYTTANGVVSFAAGQTSKTITIQIKGDIAVEPNETFTVVLSSATNATIADGQGVGTIVNDDVAPKVASSTFVVDAPSMQLKFVFDANVSASLTTADLVLRNLTTNQTIPPNALVMTYQAGNTAVFTAPGYTNGILPDGRYRATLSASGISDAAGRGLDGDGDGQPGGDVSYDFFFLDGDANRDASVNFNDLVVLAQNYNTIGTTFSKADFNYDAKTDFNDLVILAQRYNLSLPAAAAPLTASASVFSANPINDDNDSVAQTLLKTPDPRPTPARKRPPASPPRRN